MKITGSHLIARALRAEGVEKIFALAGDHTLPMMDVLAQEGFQFIDTRHEQNAVFMATAWGKITGSPGISMFTPPGHANAIAGLTLAHHMESPVINIGGCADQSRLGQGAMQEIDQVGMAAPVTRGAWFVSDPYRIPYSFALAFRTALAGRRGPVHLTVPLDVQEAEIDESRVRFYEPREYRPSAPVLAHPDAVKDALALLQKASRPMIVAGNGAFGATRASLERLIEVSGIPLFTEEAARGVVSDSHPLCFGFADGRVNDAAQHLRDADAVLFLGKKLDYTISFGGPPTFDPEARVIQVEPSRDLVGISRGADLSLVGDVGAVVDQLTAEAERLQWAKHPMLGELEEAARVQERSLESRAKGSSPLHAMDVHVRLRPLVDDDTCLIYEGSDFALYGAAYYPSQLPHRWFTGGTLGMIGWGVPFGLGAKVALPDSKVIVLTGDGAFGFSGMELDTAVRHHLAVATIVGNDAVWGIDYHQQVAIYGRTVATELLPSRYDKVAEGLGAQSEHVERADELGGALERTLSADGPALLNVRTQPSPSPLTEHILKVKGPRQGA